MSIIPNFRNFINFRDLGGYQSLDGRTIKSGLLYRSGGIYLMNDSEIESFLSLGIKRVMDLRTSVESDMDPDPILPGVEMIRHSGLVFRGGEEIDFSPVGMSKIGKEGFEQLSLLTSYYKEMPFDNEAIRILMSRLEDFDVPLVFHCATGKDRTGIAAMVILLALGIPEETVLYDYMLSNDFHRDKIEMILSENAARISEHPILGELLSMRTGVTEKIGQAVLDAIKERYRTYENYLDAEFSLSGASLTKFRNLYLI